MLTKDIYLAAGCFWGAERYLKGIRGVVRTETGYANGNIAHPTYREVYTDSTGAMREWASPALILRTTSPQ